MSRAEYNREWRAKNRERVNARQRELRALHPERYREYDKKSYYSDVERRRAKSRKTLYGITKEEWEKMFEKQGRRCAICKSPSPHSGSRPWHTDHCKKTKIVRGILCKKCNVGLGYVREDPAILRAMIEYLGKTPKKAA